METEIIKQFENIIYYLTNRGTGSDSILPLCNPQEEFKENKKDSVGIAKSLNSAFLITLSGKTNTKFNEAKKFLEDMSSSPEWGNAASFFLNGVGAIGEEINNVCKTDKNFKDRLESLSGWLSNPDNQKENETAEKIWSLFFPEASGITDNKEKKIDDLIEKRKVTDLDLNQNSITNPAQQVLFTSNILLTVPSTAKPVEDLPFSNNLKDSLINAGNDKQLYWYDHPVQIGVEPEKNEIIYGLRSLEKAIKFEIERGCCSSNEVITCILSASVTHSGLQDIARKYIEEEFHQSGALKHLDVYVFTELETRRIIDEILIPAAGKYLDIKDPKEVFAMFGVDGEYGRHYSFLKSIAAFWQVLINPEIKATFKIDLDQVFPQKELVEQTGSSAFEHLKSPLWGSKGVDSNGKKVEFGMIAGALVNEKDISNSLFTPDVKFSDRSLAPDEYIFSSTLPQALSTRAEMMTRYTTDELDGKKTCLQRVHVTGGTNGILINSLFKYKPFTPSFIGRAEDQAYIMSVISNTGDEKLVYLHKDGLIMRHDKEGFAQEAIQSAYAGKLLGDYIRIIYFSAYARMISHNIGNIKESIDPFTGCFISKIPVTVVYLRFAFKTSSFFNNGKEKYGIEFVANGSPRIEKALNLANNNNQTLKQTYDREQNGWRIFYDTLNEIKNGVNNNDSFAKELQQKAKSIIKNSYISFNHNPLTK